MNFLCCPRLTPTARDPERVLESSEDGWTENLPLLKPVLFGHKKIKL